MSYTDLDPDYYERQQRMVEIDQSILSMTNAMRANLDLPPIQSESVDFGRKARVDAGDVGADYDYTMQFADAEYTTPLNVDCLKDADYRADLRWPADGRLFSYPPCYETKADPDVNTQVEVPELMYTVYDTESSKWVDVPFHVAWLFYSLFMFMGQLLVFGFSTILFHWPLGVYVMWGIVNLLSLPFLSYWWTKHARDRHYGRAELRTR